jgi:hypothetical protein
MHQAVVRIGDREFGRADSGLVYCEISVVVDGICFPDPRWTDFAVVVLAWWCEALLRLLRGQSGRIEVEFMEGPYLVELQHAGPGSVLVSLVEAGLERRVEKRVEAETFSLAQSVVAASDRVLLECRTRKWWSADADKLQGTFTELRQELGRTVN